MLQTNNLFFEFQGGKSFTYPDIKLSKGEGLLISGKSGVGKSTLLSILAGIRKPISGKYRLDNLELTELSLQQLDKERAGKIALIFQESWFVQSLTVLENLKMVQSFAQTKDVESIHKLANRLEISGVLNKKPFELSTGEKQRAALIRALCVKPLLILADEPTSNLDDDNCATTISLLQEFVKEYQAMLIVVSHDNRLDKHFTTKLQLKS
ncbi:MAG: ATP-binding cassette domain-containing protein [Luteibaculaceae bacterium]